MAKNLPYVMTWIQACAEFEESILPMVQDIYEQDGEPDYPARSEEWNNWTDSLCENEQISDWQNENWDPPACCDR